MVPARLLKYAVSERIAFPVFLSSPNVANMERDFSANDPTNPNVADTKRLSEHTRVDGHSDYNSRLAGYQPAKHMTIHSLTTTTGCMP
jgi:hypothetical protein